MARFLIEVPHEEDTVACARVVKVFLDTGSHYLTQAEWGCEDGDHRAWMMVDATDHDEALSIVPPPMRKNARAILLTRFTHEEIDAILEQHNA